MNQKEYYEIVEEMTQKGYQGGIIYDALIMKCAYKSKVDHLLTLNVRDFARLQKDKRRIDIIGF